MSLNHVTSDFMRLSIIVLGVMLSACIASDKQIKIAQPIETSGKWILEADKSSMLDPQTSGLSYFDGKLFSVSDGSAHDSQIKKLHMIQPQTGEVVGKLGPFVLSEALQTSCFASYLNARPDYEGLVSIPGEPNSWLLVTEDATRSGEYSDACKQRFANSGSTEHPSLLVKVSQQDNNLRIVGVRALQFAASDAVGNFPNDGIEGITISKDGRIFLGLEKDSQTKPRIFELPYTHTMFKTLDAFLPVKDSNLWLPEVAKGNHPINGMDVYYPNDASKGVLILSARNDNQLWIVDLAKQQPTKVIDVVFKAPCEGSASYNIAITGIEGIAVHQDTLYLINDPWKKVYPANTNLQACPGDKTKYDRMSPLLFSIPANKLTME